MTTQDRLEKNYKANGGTKALPWAQIIQALMSILNGCMKPTEVKAWSRDHPLAAKALMGRKLRQEGYKNKDDRDAIVDAAYATLMAMPNAELE
jgi:hypothetical protein